MLGESVSVRKVSNRIVVKNRPKLKMGKPTDGQAAFQRKFRAASQYAKKQIAQPEANTLYAARINGKRDSAYRVAMTDYLTTPVVEAIDALLYRGVVGGVIVVTAFDDFMVTTVKIVITNAAGVVIEEGEAILDAMGNDKWQYKATIANPSLAGTKIQAVAYDRPGNTGTAQIVL